MLRPLVFVSVACLVGCGGETTPDAAVVRMDAGLGRDAGSAEDAGGEGRDAGPPLVDAGPRDASASDASADPDAGSIDAGALADAGPSDAALPDAGPGDAGPISMPCMATGTCDPFDVASCPAGQKCRVLPTGAECQDLRMDPPLTEGASCASELDCGPALWCVNFDGSFVCTAMCPAGSIGACGPDGACIGTVGAETCVRACRPVPARCDIYTQDCADAGDMCTLANDPETGEPYTGCRPNGTVGLDEPCGGSLGRCARGLICIREGADTTCRQVCGPAGGAPTCAAGACTGLARTWGVPYCH
ncbi:MAG: hypothetical protein H6719_04780 [Sandaracinaceae bacterium]|nr:hypothetical protein [Sandaracinaceae bacterium]